MNSFKITNLKAFNVSLGNESSYWENYKKNQNQLKTKRFTLKEGWQTIYSNNVNSVIIRCELDDGSVGWGEPNTPIAPEVVAILINDVLSEVISLREFGTIQEVSEFIYKLQSGRGYFSGYWQDMIAALDIALWDAVGKRDKFRVFEALEFQPQEKFPVYLSGLRQETLQKRQNKLTKMIDNGLSGVKIFLSGSTNDCLDELKALQSVGRHITDFMVDMLWSCDYEEARRLKETLGTLNVKFLECPLQPEDLEDHQKLVREPGTKIALGEHFRNLGQIIPWLENKAVDVLQPDIGRTGITGFIGIKKECDKYGIPVAIHMGNGLSVFQAATLSCAASYEQTYLQEFQEGLANQFSNHDQGKWKYEKGNIISTDSYGIGVDDSSVTEMIEILSSTR